MKDLRFLIFDFRFATARGVSIFALLFLVGGRLLYAAEPSEQQLIQVLQSNASPAEKDAACAKLKRVGTEQSVPALAALLTDEQLSHSARYALEPMKSAAARQALLDALGKTSGLTLVGIIQSLGERREPRAVSPLAMLLAKPEEESSTAAARALGQIGGPEALTALRAAAKNPTGPIHDAAVDGLLRCATRLLAEGNASSALTIFQPLYDGEKSPAIRVAAYRGMIRASGTDGLKLLVQGISGPPGASQTAALQLVRELQVPEATKAVTELLPKVPEPVQVALIASLGQRGDPAAVPAIAALVRNASPSIRLASIQALDPLGDASVVPLLAGFAASTNAAEQTAARQALTDLNRGPVTETLLNQLAAASPEVKAELARALGSRGAAVAVPRLVEMAQQGPPPVRKAALPALAQLVTPAQLGSLVALVLQVNDEAGRSQAAEALNTACQRLLLKDGKLTVEPLLTGLKTGSTEARLALLPICSGLNDPSVRAALRSSLQEQNPNIRTGAIRAMCDSSDPELLHDLVGVARQAREPNLQTLAISGSVRLATQEGPLPRPERVAVLRELLGLAARPEQKRLVLAGLGETAEPEALKAVETVLADQAVAAEAARAAIKIAAALPGAEAQSSVAVLNQALVANPDAATRRELQTTIKQIEESADFIIQWQVAGPFQQAGKDYAALFDMVFPPETGDAQAATWRALPPAADPKRPWAMDLLKTIGGDERVAYARTWVHSDHNQSARLELGSDDGLKVWLNDQPIFSLNVARALRPGSDTVNVNLHSGWNSLLLKITQHNQGWAFCARLRKSDGSHLGGLRFDAQGGR
jgi:HEAT repeat protein